MAAVPARVITVSDRCSAGEAVDRSGSLARTMLEEAGASVDAVDIVPDGVEPVRGAIGAAISAGARLIVTTGGTGISPSDLTPEATEPLLVARLDGLAEQIRTRGQVPTAGCRAGWWASPRATPMPR
jgi:molybdenum cofactor synthesis domain-containing protein